MSCGVNDVYWWPASQYLTHVGREVKVVTKIKVHHLCLRMKTTVCILTYHLHFFIFPSKKCHGNYLLHSTPFFFFTIEVCGHWFKFQQFIFSNVEVHYLRNVFVFFKLELLRVLMYLLFLVKLVCICFHGEEAKSDPAKLQETTVDC